MLGQEATQVGSDGGRCVPTTRFCSIASTPSLLPRRTAEPNSPDVAADRALLLGFRRGEI